MATSRGSVVKPSAVNTNRGGGAEAPKAGRNGPKVGKVMTGHQGKVRKR